MGSTCIYPIGGRIARRFSPRRIISVVAPLGLSGILISSFMENYWAWLFMFSFSFGLTNGCLYIVPMQAAWKHFPKRVGLAGGIVISGFGFGSFFFNFITTALANPNRE